MTLRGEATVQTNSDTVDIISGIGFPGLSIKGLISIGPEFALTGSMDASLSVSGEINAGLSVGFDKTTVFFPNTEAASEDSSEPGSEGDTAMSDYTPTYDVEASLDAALSAEGNLARMYYRLLCSAHVYNFFHPVTNFSCQFISPPKSSLASLSLEGHSWKDT